MTIPARALVALFIANFVAVALIWWGGLDPRALDGLAGRVNAAGRITALLGTYLVLVQLVLRTHVPWLARSFGKDALRAAHTWNAYVAFTLIGAHAALQIVGYALQDRIGIASELELLMAHYEGMVLAIAGLLLLAGLTFVAIDPIRHHMAWPIWRSLHLYAYRGAGGGVRRPVGGHVHEPRLHGIARKCAACGGDRGPVTRRTENVMGDLPFTVEVPGVADPAVLGRVFAGLRWVDRTFSPYLATSAVGRMNAGTLQEDDADPRVREVLALCRMYGSATRGYFSAWESGRLDPCGLVKGWAIDRACEMLERAGHRSYVVDGAGDVRVSGGRPDGRPWRIGVRHPVRRDRVVHVLEATDLAVATSGTYEQGAHIRDPHTARPATELVSLTVIGPDILDADVYATAAFAMGRAGIAFIEEVRGYEAYAIDDELCATATSGYAELIAG